MESGIRQADRRTGNTQPAVSRIERGSERSRANPKERLQYLASETAGAAAPQGAGYGAITGRAAGIVTPPPCSGFIQQQKSFLLRHRVHLRKSNALNLQSYEKMEVPISKYLLLFHPLLLA